MSFPKIRIIDIRRDKTEKKKELRYKIGVCDWMILKRQKLSALKRTHEIGADGIELDMGGLGNRETFDNKLLEPVFRCQYKEELGKFQIEISSIAMSGFYAQSFPERETYKLMVRDGKNAIFTFIQKYQSEKIMESFKDMMPEEIDVLRDERRIKIPAKKYCTGRCDFSFGGR